MKYYIKINEDNSIERPYIFGDDSEAFDGFIETTKEIVDKFLKYKNKGFVVYYNDGELSYVHYMLTDKYLCDSICDELKSLLTKTDSTQYLDNRLTTVKQLEFANYRSSLRTLISQVINKEILPADVIIPEVPSYE